MAAKLTSSASSYPFSFIIHRFIQYAYVPIVHLSLSLSRSSYPFSSLKLAGIKHPRSHSSSSRSFSIPLPRLHGVSRVHAILHSFTYPLQPLTRAPMSIQSIPILHATRNHVHSIRTHHTRNSSRRHYTWTPIASGISPLPTLHPDAHRIRNSPAAIIPGHVVSRVPSPPWIFILGHSVIHHHGFSSSGI